MEKIKGVLITNNGDVKTHTLELKSYKDFYPILNCGCFTIVTRNFNGHNLDIYCDDEGLFKSENKPTIYTFGGSGRVVEKIVGNAFICKCDDEGKTISLDDDEIKAALGCVYEIPLVSPHGREMRKTFLVELPR